MVTPVGLVVLGVVLLVLEVVLVVLGVVLRQCSEQMFGTDVRNRQCSGVRTLRLGPKFDRMNLLPSLQLLVPFLRGSEGF